VGAHCELSPIEQARGVALLAYFYNPIPPLIDCSIPSHRGPPAVHIVKGLSFYIHTCQRRLGSRALQHCSHEQALRGEMHRPISRSGRDLCPHDIIAVFIFPSVEEA